MKKSTFSIILILLAISIQSILCIQASATSINDLKNKFPSGTYWNHPNGGNNPDGYSYTPCSHHNFCDYYGNCACNSFSNAIQCHGFVLKLGFDYYGSDPRNWTQLSTTDSLKPGDIARYWGGYDWHSIWVTAINSDTITFADCNSDGHCKIRWDQTISKSSISSSLDYVLSAPFPIDNNEFNNPIDLGTGFYAYIMNTKAWKPITCDDNGNVCLRTETHTQNQMWKFERLSDGSYKISSLKDGKCLDTDMSGTNNGTNVKTCEYYGNSAQQWFIYGESGQYKLRSKCTDCVLDISNGDFSDGSNVQMWEYNNTDSQKFQIYGLSRNEALGYAIYAGDDFYAYIMNTKAWKPIGSDPSGNVVLQDETGSANQVWKFERLSDGSYKIISLKDGKCLDTDMAGGANGTNIKTCEYYGNSAQQWFIYGYDGNYKLRSKCTGCVMDLSNGTLSVGTNVQTWEYNDTAAQKFQIYKLELGNPDIYNLYVKSENNINELTIGLTKYSAGYNVIAAFYDKNGEIIDFQVQQTTAILGEYKFLFSGENINYIKAFVWDSMDNMVPICDSKTLYIK